jgi:hypothetical protein
LNNQSEREDSKTFGDAYCANLAPSENYAEGVFFEALYWHARLLARPARAMKPDFFDDDFDAILALRDLRKVQERDAVLARLHTKHKCDPRWLRRTLLLRVSARKLVAIWRRAFQAHSPPRQQK